MRKLGLRLIFVFVFVFPFQALAGAHLKLTTLAYQGNLGVYSILGLAIHHSLSKTMSFSGWLSAGERLGMDSSEEWAELKAALEIEQNDFNLEIGSVAVAGDLDKAYSFAEITYQVW